MMLKSNGYREISLDLSKERRIQETHFQIEEGETLFFFKSSNPHKLESKIKIVLNPKYDKNVILKSDTKL